MADPIIFKITKAGKRAALNAEAEAAQVKVNLTQVAVGTAKRTVTGSETALTNEVRRGSIVSGDVEVKSNTLRFTGSMTIDAITPIYEIGLMTDDDVLFAVASSSTKPLFTLHPNITFVIGFGLSLDEVAADNITVTTDPNGALSIIIMEQHLAAPDPHPQYLNNERFQFAMRALYPIGYQYNTHTPSNPKPIFDDILGTETQWRRITGKMFVATDPNDPFISEAGVVLGQRGITESAGNARPHVYPLQTTHVFERYDPDENINTVWTIRADRNSVDEGGSVRFTISANNLPDGGSLDWVAKEGVLNRFEDNITNPEQTKQGSVTLKNGQGYIDFKTMPDDNEIGEQKHIRLTVGAPANLAINVPINDLGNTETVIHINTSTTQGIILDEYFNKQSGNYPRATDNVRFIIDEGVKVIAPNVDTPAIQDGRRWPDGSKITIENRGHILGRGGNGGMGAVLIRDARYNKTTYFSEAATAGGDGGTAIKAVTRDIQVDNHSLIAGGGGGGGGGGAFAYDYSDEDYTWGHQNGTAAGGGAPLGLASINVGSAEWYLQDSRNPNTDEIARKIDLSLGAVYGLKFTGSAVSDPALSIEGRGNSDTPISITGLFLRDAFRGLPLVFPKQYGATDSGELYTLFRSQIDADTDGNVFFQKVWTDSSYTRYNMSSLAMKATNGTTSTYGRGGYSVGALTRRGLYQAKDKFDLSLNRGGHGGSFGGKGGSFSIINLNLEVLGRKTTSDIADLDPVRLTVLEPAEGGQAGLIKEGNVTINNLSGGTTKGR